MSVFTRLGVDRVGNVRIHLPHIVRGTSMTKSAGSVLQGSVDVLILKTLDDGPAHGYGISRTVRERTEGAIQLKDAALYQALHRLEAKGWVKAEWGLSDNNRKAKYYRLTRRGSGALETEKSSWGRYVDAVAKVLASEPGAA